MSQLLTQWDQPSGCSSPRVSAGPAGGAGLQQEDCLVGPGDGSGPGSQAGYLNPAHSLRQGGTWAGFLASGDPFSIWKEDGILPAVDERTPVSDPQEALMHSGPGYHEQIPDGTFESIFSFSRSRKCPLGLAVIFIPAEGSWSLECHGLPFLH